MASRHPKSPRIEAQSWAHPTTNPLLAPRHVSPTSVVSTKRFSSSNSAHGDPLTDSANRQVARHATRSAPARNRGRLRAQRIRTLRLAARLPLSLRRRAWRRRGGARAAGHFLYTDLRPRHLVADWESAIAEAPMALRSERVVNAEVLRGIEKIRIIGH
jgi:hypothetical protein